MCIGILSQSRTAVIGDTLVISIKSILLNRKLTHQKKRKILKGGVYKAALIRSRQIQKRWGGQYLKCGSNSVVIVGNWDLPVANRIYGPVLFEFRRSKFLKIAMLSEGTI